MTHTHQSPNPQHAARPLAGAFRAITRALLCVAFAIVTLAPTEASAQQVYWDMQTLLVDFFPDAERVTYVQTELDDEALAGLEALLGYRPDRTDWTVFVALTGDTVDGYAIIDDELGQHEPITFGVRMRPDATIDRVEVMVYREHYGDEVRDERFRRQFVGRDANDPMRLGREIVAVSGATISSRSLSRGARRASAVVGALLAESDDLLAAR